MADLHLRCQCQKVKAVVRDQSPRVVSRVICYCKFCQSYARHLGQDDEILDEQGGTEVVQVQPSRLEFVEGEDQLACLTLTKSGPLRWYTKCCKTPIANTLANRKMPFVGILAHNFDQQSMSEPIEDVVGPLRARVNGDFGNEAAKMKAGRWALTAC